MQPTVIHITQNYFSCFVLTNCCLLKCTIIVLKSLISVHFNNTIITDSFCTMNTNHKI